MFGPVTCVVPFKTEEEVYYVPYVWMFRYIAATAYTVYIHLQSCIVVLISAGDRTC